MAVQISCAATTAASFPDTSIGQTANLVIVAERNDGGADPRALPISIDGPNAASFSIDALQSTCDSLPNAPGDVPPPARAWFNGEICNLAIAFTPTALGPQHATLHLGGTDLPLAASAVAAPAGLIASVRNVAMLGGALGTNTQIDYLIINQGSAPITLGSTGVSGPGLAVTSTGANGQTIAPGGAIHAALQLAQSTRGCTAGAFTIASSASPVEIPITSWTFGSVQVDLAGAGKGHVVSSPPGIDCDHGAGVCARVFFEDQVVLTQTPEDGSHFNGWGNSCEYDPTCTVAPLVFPATGGARSALVRAAFASPSAAAVRVDFVGTGMGRVEGAVSCSRSCTSWSEPGTTVMLAATTPSTFGGWSGDCTSASKTCDLSAVVNDRHVTAAFTGDAREMRTLLDPSSRGFTAGAITSDGDLVVAGNAQGAQTCAISRRSPDGAVRWSTSIGNVTAHAVALDIADSVYVLADNQGQETLIKLDAGGNEQWRRDLGLGSGIAPTAIGVLPDGRVAAIGVTELRVFAADGSTSWTTDISSCAPTAVAASPANAVVAACRDGVLLRFDSTGAPLTAWAIPDNANQVHTVSMAFDAQGALFIHATRISSAHQGTRVITRLDATGAALFSITEPVPAVQSSALDYSVARPGLRMTSNGQAFLQLPHHELLSGIVLSTADAGGLIETFTAAGGASWSLDKPFVVTYSPYATFDAAEILDSACDGSGHCALFGAYGDSGWIEELSVP